ncbi:MAG TPA: phosphoribosylformylglycinamidine synthase [Candidatus Saccharimonadales bacterium]|nr:phosphoribosylformylglycinamidine synthase [Candidatus Saccharimonadales bacterium]
MRKYFGINALSRFRTNQLLKLLQEKQPAIDDLSAEYVHFVDLSEGSFSKKEDDELKKLLTYETPYTGDRKGRKVVVVPRQGTISPWSTKATNIAKNSGLKCVSRIERGVIYYLKSVKDINIDKINPLFYDRMREMVLSDVDSAQILFKSDRPRPVIEIDVLKNGIKALERANLALGLALNDEEIEYLLDKYKKINRNPTDAELVMFGQINSEHCRHKIFNADWVIDDKKQPKSLFKMIKNTHEKNSSGVISAYSDNASVLKGPEVEKFYPEPESREYKVHKSTANLVIKAETHNHPTAIAPAPGAATGVGGEIRDEAATGRGAKSKMGFTGYSVSNLEIPGYRQPWENHYGKPSRISSALEIMMKAPIGGASFANEFGRPNLAGYFRAFQQLYKDEVWGYHKPLMIAGGLGNIDDKQVKKMTLEDGDLLIILGGPSMLIGLGGGASSSMQSGQSEEDLDFASVQRANAEMQRRAQEVISQCSSMPPSNPIKSIHDVGAGGLSNAIPEIAQDNNLGAEINLRDIPSSESGLSPMEIWCNEAQERFVLAINESDLDIFSNISEREKCPYAVVGKVTKNQELVVYDEYFKNKPINIPMSVLFGSPPKLTKTVFRDTKTSLENKTPSNINIEDAIEKVMHVPSVGSKKFLITIGDRTVGGMSVRDPMVGPWQVPVSDVAVTANSFNSDSGEALSIGERTPIALLNAPASARMAIGEAITNISAARITKLTDIKLSANWMAASGHKNEDEKLFDTVKAVGEELCPKLGLTIPVGKDSLSMRTSWRDSGKDKSVASPVSLIISAFAPIEETSAVLTPMLHKEESTTLIFIDLANGKKRLGGSAFAQAYGTMGNSSPDMDDPELIKNFFASVQKLSQRNLISAYHDRSDGGLLTTLLEMAFSGRCGLSIDLSELSGDLIETLFNEELGAVIEVSKDATDEVGKILKSAGLPFYKIGKPANNQKVEIKQNDNLIYSNTRRQLESWWSETSYQIQKIRDNGKLASEEFNLINDDEDPGISPKILFDINKPKIYKRRPKVAVLREQGVNGQIEMAAAFWEAGFNPVDVHMSDLMSKKVSINDFLGLITCGGFSYGDVLGGGGGWAKSILFNQHLKSDFKKFFARKDTFSLGVCNGCQMFSQLKDIIPGAEFWPRFLKNESEQFEARLVSVKVNDSPSIFFKDMSGSILPVPTAHGEGKAVFEDGFMQSSMSNKLAPLQYVDNEGESTEKYPFNPNGSPDGITALTTPDGRSTIIMPHPERAFLSKQLSWHPDSWSKYSPWIKMFRNAREWVN